VLFVGSLGLLGNVFGFELSHESHLASLEFFHIINTMCANGFSKD
jgi:hypothetical protein